MTPIENSQSQIENPGEREALPLSLLNDFLYCPRRAALKLVEGWREANQHTERGDIVHEHADLPGYESQISNSQSPIILLRALPIWSESLGLSGKCDIVEQRSDGSLFPVEFKLGKRRQWENDDVQVCAQALCLEEMFNFSIPCGAIFHADSMRRREVEFTPELRKKTEMVARDLHALLESTNVPPAIFRRPCEECSLFDICLPKATGVNSRADRLARTLYEI